MINIIIIITTTMIIIISMTMIVINKTLLYHGRHVYIFLVIIGLVTFSGTEEGPVVFMFYKRQ